MVRTTLKWLFIAIIVGLVILWILGGGFGKIVQNARTFSTSFSIENLLNGSSSIASFHLPFSPDGIPQMVPSAGDGYPAGQYQEDQAPSTRTNGDRSPHAGEVVLAQAAAQAHSATAQYIEISVAPGSGTPIDISGWSLQSPLSGVRAVIPQAASPFVMGRINTVQDVMLAPGAVVIVATGASPIGTSFSENMCTGYLGTLQPFVPPLPQQCPSPTSEIPDTAANETRLGSTCFAYIKQLSPCTFPANPPSNLSPACRNEIQTKLSYSGCVNTHKTDASFSRNAWRLYLSQGAPLWNTQHDVVRLLDGEGRIVNVLNY